MQKPFEGVENLEAAYDLESPEDNIKLYAAWADTYDTGYRASMDYILHRQVGETYHAVGGGPKVLDIGAGTGALAEVMVPLAPMTWMPRIFRNRCWMLRHKRSVSPCILVRCDRCLAR